MRDEKAAQPETPSVTPAKSAAGKALRTTKPSRASSSAGRVLAKKSATRTGTSLGRVRDRRPARDLDAQRRAIAAKTAAVVELAGSKAEVARLLNVSRTQPGQWIRGDETPTPDTWELLVDLEYVMSRAAFVRNPELVMPWLHSSNSFLNGARPIDVLRLHGPGELIATLNAEYAGSYA